MKTKLWLFQVPVVMLFTAGLWIYESGTSGDLKRQILRESVFPSLRSLEGKFTDWKFKLRGQIKPKNKIVIVAIDDESIRQIGRWPWGRDKTSYLIYQSFLAGAKYVGLDIVFSEREQVANSDLEEHLKQNKMGHLLDEFSNDFQMSKVIAAYRDNLVLGWAAEAFCQPAYDPPSICPTKPAEGESFIPPQFEKFTYDSVNGGQYLDHSRTPLITVFSFLSNILDFNAVAKHAGYFNTWSDSDGVNRRTNLLVTSDGKVFPSLALSMAKTILGENLDITFGKNGKVEKLKFAKSGRAVPVSPVGAMDINFRGPSYTFPYVMASELMGESPKLSVLPAQPGTATRAIAAEVRDARETMKDAIVLIGVSALAAFDMRAFPFDENTPGVEGHANILDNLLSGDMLTHGSGATRAIWLFLLMTVGALLFAYLTERLESVPALLLFILSMGAMGVIDLKILFENNINWNTSLLYIEVFTIFVLTLAAKYVLEERNKKFIRGAFAKYVAPAIVDSILKDPTKLSVGGEKRNLTILFSDIRGFTTFSETLDAKKLAQFLNDYLGIMTDIVFDNEGTLDKYIGDAVMAFWGAPLDQPKHAANACKAAIKMLRALDEHKARFKSQYGVDVSIGIGINSGPVNVGNMGSERIFEYTVIGDHVNLASRLEGLTKYYGAGIVTSRFTFDMIKSSGESEPPHRVLDFVKVKGKKQAVELIQVLERDYSPKGLEIFEEGRHAYLAQRWDEAIAKFTSANELLRQSDDTQDGPCAMYIERCKEFKLNPPNADWDGSWEMTSK